MTRAEWVERYRAKVVALTGWDDHMPAYMAGVAADIQRDENGLDSDAWDNPEDAAHEELTYWIDDGP